MTIEVAVLRSSRRVALSEAKAHVDGRHVMTVRMWSAAPAPDDIPVRGLPPSSTPQETAASSGEIPGAHNAGYLAAVEWRFVAGGFAEAGPASVWARPRVGLVDDEPMSGWERTLLLADSGSGISLVAPPTVLMTINCDVQVALHREPIGPWVLMESATHLSPGAGGVTTSEFSDVSGAVGTGTQGLLVANGAT